jgi:ATP-dependent DNA ligase
VFTRSGLDWTKRFTEIAGALAKATWVEPEFTAEIEYPDITSEGLLRQSAFKGLNRD